MNDFTIVGIDPGSRNLGIVILSGAQVTYAKVWDLKGPRKKGTWKTATKTLERKIEEECLDGILNSRKTRIFVEGGQMGNINNGIEAWIRGRYRNSVSVCKRTYCPEACRGNYEKNKRAAVELTQPTWEELRERNPLWSCPEKKLNHIADALLIVKWVERRGLGFLETN